jgi:putative aldouronate transport system substrate-binding protein
MHTFTRRTAFAGTAALATTATLSACGKNEEDDTPASLPDPDDNFNSEDMPIVDDKTTLTFMTGHFPKSAKDWNNVASMETMEKLSNIHVEWGFVPWEDREEKRNLALASGEYPEVLHRTAIGAADVAKYGEQGVFLALNDAIDKYMPNLKKILDENDDMRKGVTQPDGNIYSLPTIYDPKFDSANMQHQIWVRKDWLDTFGMDEPETLEEFEAYLKEVKDTNPTKDGNEAIPYATSNDALFVQLLNPAFGIANHGLSAGNIDLDDDNKLRFWRTSDAYREQLTYIHGLYDQGLIQKDIFAVEEGKFASLGSTGVYGAVGSQAPSQDFGKDVGENYVALKPLKKKDRDDVPPWSLTFSPLKMIGQFVLTDKAEHPLEACRWMDYFYGDEGCRLFFMGVEGQSYEKKGDTCTLLPKITDNPDGLTLDEAIKPYVTYLGGSYAGIVKEEYFQGTEGTAQAREGTKVVSPYKIDDVWPVFTFTSDEAEELASITPDMDKLTQESQAKFINGDMNLDDDWAEYVKQFDQIGLDRYLEIQQAAYDRFSK